VLDVTVECDVCEGRRRLCRGQGVGVNFPFVILMAEHELSSLVGSRVDDDERPEHVCAPGRILMCPEERIFA